VYAEAQLAAARRLHGEALWALGKKDEARAAWKDIPVVLSEVEKVAGPSLGR
jgi:predicted negative regulator of RcsB-dependent stress response